MSKNRELKAKIYDPVFICMLVAVVLAVGSSVMLRAMSKGPPRARASDVPVDAPALKHIPQYAPSDE